MTSDKPPLFRPNAATTAPAAVDAPFTLTRFRAFSLLPYFWLLTILAVGAALLLLRWQTAVYLPAQAYYLQAPSAQPALAIELPANQLDAFANQQTVTIRSDDQGQQAEVKVIQIMDTDSDGQSWRSQFPASPNAGYILVAYPPQWPIPQTTPSSVQLSLGQKSLFQLLFASDF